MPSVDEAGNAIEEIRQEQNNLSRSWIAGDLQNCKKAIQKIERNTALVKQVIKNQLWSALSTRGAHFIAGVTETAGEAKARRKKPIKGLSDEAK
jgi:predicted DNA-binding protein YlxM (UPF0122 family)